MGNGSHIRAVGDDGATEVDVSEEAPLELDTLLIEDDWLEVEEEAVKLRSWRDWILPGIFLNAIIAWTAFFVWAHYAKMLAGAGFEQWSTWATQWATPTLLVMAIWLVAMRSSKREAARFGDVARALSLESRALEERLTVANRELSLAREFLAEQTRELDYLGRTAAERLSSHAHTLQTLIKDNGVQVDAIAKVSESALENMGKLRDDLPVIANSARDVSNRIGGAGREAKGQLDQLIAGFDRLNEFGEASEAHVQAVRSRVDAALEAFARQTHDLQSIADERFIALREQSEQFRTEMAGREIDALAAIRKRASTLSEEIERARQSLEGEENAALGILQERLEALAEKGRLVSQTMRETEATAGAAWNSQTESLKNRLVGTIEEIQRIDSIALENAQKKLGALREEAERVDANLANRNRKFLEEMASRQKIFAEAEEQALAAVARRFAELDAEIAERRDAQLAQIEALASQEGALAEQLTSLDDAISRVAASVGDAEAVLNDGSAGLIESLHKSRKEVLDTHGVVNELTEASVRLLELIQAGSQHSKTDLVESLSLAETRLSEVEQRGEALKLMLDSTEEKGKSLSDYVIRANTVSEQAFAHIDKLHNQLANVNQKHMHELAGLQETIVNLGQQSEALSKKTQGELREAILQLEHAAQNVSETLAGTTQENISSLANAIGEESAKAVDKALSEHTRQAISDLESATARASQVSREAAIQLRDQLLKVDELAGNLEARVSRAKEKAQEETGNDFARRMALITESLNSSAIDIAKIFDSDVPDTTWASYLRGDRGIFTRRAVRLLDNVEARDIAEIYDRDPEFRDTVSHYIADFEAMLRTLLSTREGNALSVTMLGSDMGKLYVALAQALERLRA